MSTITAAAYDVFVEILYNKCWSYQLHLQLQSQATCVLPSSIYPLCVTARVEGPCSHSASVQCCTPGPLPVLFNLQLSLQRSLKCVSNDLNCVSTLSQRSV